jgi:ABC-type lipoprotein export system ATPase subunit
MVVGPVGSGKSTLLRAILGEVPLLQGSIKRLSSPVAYCDQVPWLQNISIRQNIVGQDQFDKAWYQAVVSACALDIDMQQLPEGDQTLVGTGGVSLSGGQKQRVALARAVYSKESLVLLDDALSALDSTTARVCFSRLMGPEGLWRKGDTAVVMVTHAGRLSSPALLLFPLADQKLAHVAVEFLPHADQVIVVRNDGSVTVGAARGNIPQMNQESFDPKHVCHDGPGEPIVADISSNRPSKPASKTAGNSKERQMGDLKLYGFYFASVGPFLFCVWLLLAAIYVAADKMPSR